MESYRFSSKLHECDREYLIQTANDASAASVLTTVYVDGVPAEVVTRSHPSEISPEEVLSFVEAAHGEKKQELETLMRIYREVVDRADSKMMHHLGTAFFYKGFYEEAKELFQRVAALDPGNHQTYNFLGMTELALGNVEQAVDSLGRAVDERPGYADYRNNLAEALLAKGAAQKAIAELEQALQTNMYYADAYFNLGLAHLAHALGNPEPESLPAAVKEISDCFHRASLIHADFRGQAFDEGLHALNDQDLTRALSVFKRVREQKKDAHRQEFAAFYIKFVMYPDWVSEKAIADRIRFLKAELAKNPTYVDMYAELAQCYFEQSRMIWKEGMSQLRTAFEANPSLGKRYALQDNVDDVYAGMAGVLEDFTERG